MFLKKTEFPVNKRKSGLCKVAWGLMRLDCTFHFYSFDSLIHTGFNLY